MKIIGQKLTGTLMQIEPITRDMFLIPSQLFGEQHGQLPMSCHDNNRLESFD
jgi:hypothetical protein